MDRQTDRHTQPEITLFVDVILSHFQGAGMSQTFRERQTRDFVFILIPALISQVTEYS
jgi:hypothetical protein